MESSIQGPMLEVWFLRVQDLIEEGIRLHYKSLGFRNLTRRV